MENQNILQYEKLFEDEEIIKGDVILLSSKYNKVLLAQNNRYLEQFGKLIILGVCTNVQENLITIANTGICDVNTHGIICVGDKLTTGSIPGKAVAIRYVNDEEIIFKKKSIGKVIGLYSVYDKARVLLDVK